MVCLDISLQRVPEDVQLPPLLVGCLGVRVNDPGGQEPGHHHCHRPRQQGDGDDGVTEGGPPVPLLPIHPYRVPANPETILIRYDIYHSYQCYIYHLKYTDRIKYEKHVG